MGVFCKEHMHSPTFHTLSLWFPQLAVGASGIEWLSIRPTFNKVKGELNTVGWNSGIF